MTTYSQTIQQVLNLCHGQPGFDAVERVCLVRDLKGRVRLVLQGGAPSSLNVTDLENRLATRTGGWFLGPILCAWDSAQQRLAQGILGQAQPWPQGWPQHWADDLGQEFPLDRNRWKGLQRVLGKQSWLEGQPGQAPWPLEEGNPAIVAFHSFKGGVGRTTTLAVLAWWFASRGKRVVCLDLDLEAPGLAAYLGCPPQEQDALEVLLAHAATERLPAERLVASIAVHGTEIGVVPAGRLDGSFPEKLARLDYLGTTSTADSPLGLALKAMLGRIRGEFKPDLILLDCRAGFHDLGGLTLTDLAHVDVLVGRNTPQGVEGTSLVLRMLGLRRAPKEQRILMVQTFVPVGTGEEPADVVAYRDLLYDACQGTIYSDTQDDFFPAPDDREAAHHPWPVSELTEIARCGTLGEMPLPTLQSPQFEAIARRLEILIQPEVPEAES